jgi:hypothetical protein
MRWPLNAAGRIETVRSAGGASAGSTHNNGIAKSANGRMQLDTAAVAATDVFAGGLRMKPTGVLLVSTAGAIAAHVGGLPVTSSGQLAVVANGTPAFWVAGVPISANGRVCVATVT